MIRYYFKNNSVHPPMGLNTFDIKSGFFNVSDTKETHLLYKGRGDLLCNASPTKETLRLCVAQLHMHALNQLSTVDHYYALHWPTQRHCV